MAKEAVHAGYYRRTGSVRSSYRQLDQRTSSDSAAFIPCGDRCGEHSGRSGWIQREHHDNLGGDQCRHRWMRKSHAYGDSNCHIHSDRNADRNRYIYAYRNGNGDGNIHANGYGNCHRHSYSYSYSYSDHIAAAYAHATASADTAASALALSGIKGTREKQTREFPASNLFKKLDRCSPRSLQGRAACILRFPETQ